MVTPYDYAKEVYGKVKQAVYPDPEISRIKAEDETTKKDRNFRTTEYWPRIPMVKPNPIKLKPKSGSSKVDVGGKK